jgi:hypothetical protein
MAALVRAACMITCPERTVREGAIRPLMFASLVALAYVSPSTVSAQQSQTSPPERYTDVFAFCKAVKNTRPSFTTDDRYAGQNPPRAVVRAMKADDVEWRCQDGEVYGCETGASGRNCRHVTTINTPDEAVKKYCHENPNSSFVPMVANSTASYWRCKDRKPVIDKSWTPDPVDDHGYVSWTWEKIPQTGGSEPEPEPTLPHATRNQETEAASAEPKYPFVTSEGAILCQTPSERGGGRDRRIGSHSCGPAARPSRRTRATPTPKQIYLHVTPPTGNSEEASKSESKSRCPAVDKIDFARSCKAESTLAYSARDMRNARDKKSHLKSCAPVLACDRAAWAAAATALSERILHRTNHLYSAHAQYYIGIISVPIGFVPRHLFLLISLTAFGRLSQRLP